MSKNLLEYDLQFFAEDEGDTSVEMSEVAEPIDEENADVDVDEESVEEQEVAEPVVDRNAIAAAARREAEAKLKERDAEYTRRFGHLKNPITGQPIQSEKDYFEALDAQETIRRNQELQEKGIDPSIIDRAIANNPVVRQAEMVIEQNKQQMLANDIENQLKIINALDPSIKTFNDLANVGDQQLMLDLVNRGYALSDAYKIANFDNLIGKKSAAAEQKAINQAKGKSHLTPTSSGSTQDDGMKDIPDSALAKWKAFFPDDTPKQLKERYNRAIKK